MRDGMTPDAVGALSAPTITTAYLARLDFKSETIFMWTGQDAIQPNGSGDPLLDGNTFQSIAYGLMVDIGENTFSYTGSEELPVTLNIPSSPEIAIEAAMVYPNEYQCRPATFWRGLMLPATDPLAPQTWIFRRIRSGKMDKVEVTNDTKSFLFKLTVESHQANISAATNQTYLNQKDYDPNDTSQDYTVACSNGSPAPSSGSAILNPGGTPVSQISWSQNGRYGQNIPRDF